MNEAVRISGGMKVRVKGEKKGWWYREQLWRLIDDWFLKIAVAPYLLKSSLNTMTVTFLLLILLCPTSLSLSCSHSRSLMHGFHDSVCSRCLFSYFIYSALFHMPIHFCFVVISDTGVLGDRHASGEEADPALQLLWGWWADGVLRAGQRLRGSAVSDSSSGWTSPAVPPCRVFPSWKEPAHLWVEIQIYCPLAFSVIHFPFFHL